MVLRAPVGGVVRECTITRRDSGIVQSVTGDIMAINCWFSQDVARILASLHQASVDTANAADMCSGNIIEYRRGYDDALHAVAVAFGLAEPKARGGAVESSAVWRLENGFDNVTCANQKGE